MKPLLIKLTAPFCIAICLIFSSCISSMYSLVDKEKIVADKRIVGTWAYQGQAYTVKPFFQSYFFSRNRKELADSKTYSEDVKFYDKGYVVEYTKEGIIYEIFGCLIQLNGNTFISFANADIRQADPKKGTINFDNTSLNGSLDTYTFAKITFQPTGAMIVDFVNGDYVYQQIKNNKLKIKYEKDDLYDTFVITASTKELQLFFEKYGNDKRLYSKENTVVLTKKI